MLVIFMYCREGNAGGSDWCRGSVMDENCLRDSCKISRGVAG